MKPMAFKDCRNTVKLKLPNYVTVIIAKSMIPTKKWNTPASNYNVDPLILSGFVFIWHENRSGVGWQRGEERKLSMLEVDRCRRSKLIDVNDQYRWMSINVNDQCRWMSTIEVEAVRKTSWDGREKRGSLRVRAVNDQHLQQIFYFPCRAWHSWERNQRLTMVAHRRALHLSLWLLSKPHEGPGCQRVSVCTVITSASLLPWNNSGHDHVKEWLHGLFDKVQKHENKKD